MTRWKAVALPAILVLIGGLVPLLIGYLSLGRVPDLSPVEARDLLAKSEGGAVLVDVRTPEEFRQRHIEGAISWPLDRIKATTTVSSVGSELRGKKLLLVCGAGVRSATAARHLQPLGIDVWSIRGGMQEWITVAGAPCRAGAIFTGTRYADTSPLAFRESSRFEQWLAVTTGFAVKPAYMLAALMLVIVLWRQASPDLVALRWAMLTFFLGEAFCALNYLVHGERSLVFEYLHSYGMVLAFAFTAYALLAGLDLRLLHYSDPRAKCAAIGLCRACVKYAPAQCALRRLFLLLIPAVALLALLPLATPYRTTAYNTRILGSFYSYLHPVAHQVYEIRLLPLSAVVLLLVAFVALLRESHPVTTSKILFAAALGAVGFSFFRLVLLSAFEHNQVYFAAWEELTELLFIVAVAWVLFIFRHGLFPEHAGQLPSATRS